MNFLKLLEAKRDGNPLSRREWNLIVSEYSDGRIPDYQMAAFLMAIHFRGLDRDETRALTLAMRDSGETLCFPSDSRPLVDKHSTGGVGDKVSLPLAPLLACLGFRVPMISGRGLGITGGTLDKLESIPGFSTALSSEQIALQVQSLGCVICGQTGRMVPADKSLYALRDVTGTVPSIPLITASILSKKLAENLDALILDVKFGRAAFMKSFEAATELAETMVSLGNECGVNTRAILTNMDTPIGRTAGNWLEVKESIACLENRGPADLQELVIECAAHLLMQTVQASDLETARAKAFDCLASGEPRRRWDEMIAAQGADVELFNRRLKLDSTGPVVLEVRTDEEGFVTGCDAQVIGEVVRDLGGGRFMKESTIHPDVGIDSLAKPGERVEAKSLLARVHASHLEQAEAAVARVKSAFEIAAQPLPPKPVVRELRQ